MRFRDATPDDAAGIALVRVAAWQHNYEDVVDARLLAGLDPVEERERWEQRLAASPGDEQRLQVGVVEHDGRVLGFAAVLARSREPDATADVGELAAIYVHPVAQGAGVGPRLLDAALATLRDRGRRRATLRVLTANDHARGFFGARGWSLDPQAPNETPDGTEAGPTERWSRAL